jgi:hypothetical protein
MSKVKDFENKISYILKIFLEIWGLKRLKLTILKRYLNFFDAILYEIQYLTAYISGNMHPIQKSQINSTVLTQL